MYSSILFVFAFLAIGYFVGKKASSKITSPLIQLIAPLVWVLLLLIGYEFGLRLQTVEHLFKTLLLSVAFAASTSLVSWFAVWLCLSQNSSSNISDEPQSFKWSLGLFKDCWMALGFVIVGGVLSQTMLFLHVDTDVWARLLPMYCLYALLFLVGVDLVHVHVTKHLFSIKTFALAVLTIAGSLIGGLLAALLMGETSRTGLVLASGLGWFSLSGILVSTHMGEFYGAVAFMTDLFRELIAIVLLYVFGQTYALPCISVGGATTLDSTLPIVKNTCAPQMVGVALACGFVLTIVAPLLITLFLEQ